MHGYYKNCGGKVGHRRMEKCTGMYGKGIPGHGDGVEMVGEKRTQHGMGKPRGRWVG